MKLISTYDPSPGSRNGHWWRLPGPQRPCGAIRPYRAHDRTVVLRDLASQLASLYPGGDAWLASRLASVESGDGYCHLVRDGFGLRAITVETPKGAAKRKLSTIWVAERARGQRLGARLLARCLQDWLEEDLDEVWVTAGDAVVASVAGLVLSRGFVQVAVERNRYGEGRDEHVFAWSPIRDAHSQEHATRIYAAADARCHSDVAQ